MLEVRRVYSSVNHQDSNDRSRYLVAVNSVN